MIHFKSVVARLGTVLLGCLVVPIAMLVWASWKSQGEPALVSFSPNSLAHSLGFWVFAIVLFIVGFVPSTYFLKRSFCPAQSKMNPAA
jgi:hypothetical protein